MSSIEIAPLSMPFSKIFFSAAPASIARVTASVLSSWIDHSLSSIFSISAASGRSNCACVPAFDRSPMRIRQAPTSCSVASKLWPCASFSASAPLTRMPSIEIS